MNEHDVIGSRALRSADRMKRLRGQLNADRMAAGMVAQEALDELETTIESLQVSAEELRAQNETLIGAREHMERENFRYQHLFDFAPDAYIVTDSDGVIREANRAAHEILGTDRRVVGRLLLLMVPEKERRTMRVRLLRLSQVHEPEQFELTLLRAGGEPVRVAAHASAVQLPGSSRSVELRWSLRSLAERERTSEMMNDSIRKGAELAQQQHANPVLLQLGNFASPVFAVDREWRLVYVNRSFERLVDVSPGELMGCDLWQVLSDAIGSRFHQRLVRAMVTGRPVRLREAYAPARAVFDIAAYPGLAGLTVVLHSTSQKRKVSASELAAGVAHYFDNYLSTIQEATEQLQLRLDVSDPLRNTASVIAHGTQLCTEVTRRLQAFTRQRAFLAQPTDVNAMLRNFRRRIGSSLGADVRVLLQLRHGLPVVALDAEQFEEALYEIVLNARDAIHDRGIILLRTRKLQRVTTARLSPSTFVGVDIQDDGIGMSADTLRYAPLPFFTTKDRTVVPGLGLAMATGIIEQAGGRMRIESEPGAGTTVRILLPAASYCPESGH